LLHKGAQISCSSQAAVVALSSASLAQGKTEAETTLGTMAPDVVRAFTVEHDVIRMAGISKSLAAGTAVGIVPESASAIIQIDSLKRNGKIPQYHGKLILIPDGDQFRVVLYTDIETYIEGVLQSEIPSSYELEAVKAQAVTARTYALRPRIDHASDHCNVCDSFLCCQYFAGKEAISARHKEAITATRGQIITYQQRPILALFSSNAGGHTENYENCFSDPKTGAFPPPPLPYLKGVPEGPLPSGYTADGVTEAAMRQLFNMAAPETDDAWATQFKWILHLSADLLESHMHHVVATMLEEKATAPFITPPPSKTFGHIHSFTVESRGVAGTAIEVAIDTSTGVWKIKKELVIRSIFKLTELKIARLKSARIFFDHHYDKLGLLAAVTIHGLGFGHGVGLQQTGAQGLANKGMTYKKIIAHYFTDTQISTV
jgi:SpoIID/LytB domain protein